MYLYCQSCGWYGCTTAEEALDKTKSPSQLKIDDHFYTNSFQKTYNFFALKCQNCLASTSIKTNMNLSLEYDILKIQNKPSGERISTTYLNIRKLLNFEINKHCLTLTKYKFTNFSHQFSSKIARQFNAKIFFPIGEEFNSEILLKIIFFLHKRICECERRKHENLVLFGKWKPSDTIFPKTKCSFCARFYEYKTKNINGWPFSSEKINQIHKYSHNHNEIQIYNANKKFATIFLEPMPPTNYKCNFHSELMTENKA